jgi:hypothetical protein
MPKENRPMKTLIIVASLTAALIAMPAIAQQGPAGVPGAPGLAPASPLVSPPAVKTHQPKRIPVDCSKAKNKKQCRANQAARKKAIEACRDKVGQDHRQCLRDWLAQKK